MSKQVVGELTDEEANELRELIDNAACINDSLYVAMQAHAKMNKKSRADYDVFFGKLSTRLGVSLPLQADYLTKEVRKRDD
jgi:hypothetical protein